jgi:hypothetical protein
MAEYERLSDVDAASISEAVTRLVSSWSEIPFRATQNTVQWGSITKETGIGLFAMQGAIYKARYISGNYIGLFPFRVVYKCNPSNNKTRISAQQVVEQLATYLKGYTGALKNDAQIDVQAFTKVSPVYQLEVNESGYEQYTCEMQVEYYCKVS